MNQDPNMTTARPLVASDYVRHKYTGERLEIVAINGAMAICRSRNVPPDNATTVTRLLEVLELDVPDAAPDLQPPERTFVIGDVVALRSGSDPMTVVQVKEDGQIGCTWAVGSSFDHQSFPAAALKLVPEK